MISRRTLALALGAIGLLSVTGPARADTVADWQPLIDEAARRFAIPNVWIARVMRAESRGHTLVDGRPIVSPKGAMGLMQLMPGTWAELSQAYGLGPDPFAPRANILAGAAYLRAMYDRFGYPGCFAAYNAGPARYAASLAGAPLPGETRAYLLAVTGSDGASPIIPRSPAARPTAVRLSVFAIQHDAAGTSWEPALHTAKPLPAAPGDALFAVRH